MNVQYLNSGRWSVQYGNPLVYQSSLRAVEESPTKVTYLDGLTGKTAGRVEKLGSEKKWYVSSPFFPHGRMMYPVKSKYEGFLFLLSFLSEANA